MHAFEHIYPFLRIPVLRVYSYTLNDRPKIYALYGHCKFFTHAKNNDYKATDRITTCSFTGAVPETPAAPFISEPCPVLWWFPAQRQPDWQCQH